MYSVDVNEPAVAVTDTKGDTTIYTSIDNVPDFIQEKIAVIKLLKVGRSHKDIGAHIAPNCYVIYD